MSTDTSPAGSTSPTTARVLTSAEVRAVRTAMFLSREVTLDEGGRSLGTPTLLATMRSMRAEIRPELEQLADGAFEPQAPTADGALVWSAGQVIDHLLDIQVNVFGGWARAAAGLPATTSMTHIDNHAEYPHHTRAECLALYDTYTAELEETLQALGDDPDPGMLSPIEDDFIHSLGAALAMLVIHDDDHLGQLRELRAAHGTVAGAGAGAGTPAE